MDGLAGSDGTFLTGEEKKPAAGKGALLLLGLVVLAAGGYFFYMKQGPQAAAGAEPEGPDTIVTFLSDGKTHAQLMKQMLDNSEKVVQRFRTYPETTQITTLPNNPFRLKPAKNDEPTKPFDPQGDRDRLVFEERKAAATAAVQKLRLQSVMAGGRVKACMLNGKLRQLGEEVDGFKIEEVEPGYIIVRTEEFRFKLQMQK
jgi:hypothetical protein